MKIITGLLLVVCAVQCASAHYIMTLIAGGTSYTAAVRQPINNSPVVDVTSNDITCNGTSSPATSTVTVVAGSTIGLILDNTIYHQGPAAIYLDKAPSSTASWDGSEANWSKIKDWGATFNPFKLTTEGLSQLTTAIPSSVSPGD
ncbi:hypothetical protein ACEPAI_6990 [Sanghuangporus weigelae]